MPSRDRTRSSRRALLRAGSGVAAAFGLTGCLVFAEPYSETAERTFDPGAAAELVVRTDSGDVALTAGDVDVVEATVEKESRSGEDALDAVTVDGTVEDDTLTVEPVWDNESLDVTVSLELTVPADLAVAEARSSNGDVSATGVTGDGTYETTNGDVELEAVDGYVSLESTNGDVRASGGTGLDGAGTTNGDVSVDVPGLRSDVTCRSNNGDVTAAVPEDLDARVELRTSNGDASVSDVSITVDTSRERRIEGTVGGGEGDGASEHTLELRSTNGDVTLLGL